MKPVRVLAIGMALGTLALAAGPAFAQRGRSRPRPQPIVVPQPPYDVRTRGEQLLQQDFMQMRRTSPDPNNFLGGQYNPRFQTIYPRPYQYYNPFPYYGGGGYYPYPYGGYPYYGGGYGSGYGAPPVQQDVYIIQGQPRAEAGGALRPETPRPSGERDGDFYLRDRPGTETLTDALDDLRKAWLNGDFERLRARFRTDGKVRIYPNGAYKYSVDSREFVSMLQEAMKRIDTLSFDFERPRSEEGGRVFVAGRHVFLDADKKKQTAHVSYVLERVNGRWRIVEAGSSDAPITRHSE